MQARAVRVALSVVVAAAAGGTAAWTAPAQDRVFTVANYPVDATAKDAVAAKDKAIADGQQAAFRSLLKRLVPVSAYKGLDRLKTVKASDYVDGFSIRSEQNSGTQYIASLDFAFEANQVRALLNREQLPIVDQQADAVVLVPVLRQTAGGPAATGGAPPAQGEFVMASGDWNSVWSGLDLANTVTPLTVTPLKATVHSDAIRSLVTGASSDGDGVLATEFGTQNVVVAVAEVDKAAGRVHVTLAGQDAVAPLLWKRSYPITDGDVGYAMELAAVISLGVIEGRWKALRNGEFSGGAATPGIMLDVQFNSMSEWDDIRARILDLRAAEDVQVNVVGNTAQVILRYPGGPRALVSELGRQGLVMEQSGPLWTVRRGY